MNESTAIFLVNKAVRALLCTYEKDTEKTTAPRTMFKTLDPSIKKDDILNVPSSTRHGVTTVRVVTTDVDVNLDDPTHVDWIMSKVDRHAYEVCLSREGDMLKLVREAEEHHKREELKAKIFKHSEAQIRELSIVSMTDLQHLPAPAEKPPE